MNIRTFCAIAAFAFAVPALHANSGSLAAAPVPPLKRTGAAADGGLTCTACHAGTANSDTRGRLILTALTYTPGEKQNIRVRLEHPEAQRWGFQLTARLVSDETRMAGAFTRNDNVNVHCDDGSMRGVPGPCSAGVLQFASHTAASSRPGTTGGVEWDVEWTAPPAGSGEVILYAAGNAANNSTNNQGDNIYNTSIRIAASAGCDLARPTLTSVVNGASFASNSLSWNTIFTLKGTGFAGAGVRREAARSDFREGKYPTDLSCIAVEVANRRAPILYIQGDQINAQAPTIADSGAVAVRVIANPGTANERASDPMTVTLQEYAPAFFTFGGTNSIAARHPDGRPVMTATPARPGDTVTLYGTGFGATDPVYQAGELPPGQARLRDRFTVMFGGLALPDSEVTYAGLAPEAVSGLYQFNIRIPANATAGDILVLIRIGSLQTQSNATLPVQR